MTEFEKLRQAIIQVKIEITKLVKPYIYKLLDSLNKLITGE